MSKTDIDIIKNIALESLDNLKTQNIISIDLSKKSNFTDLLIIGTGTSSTHIKAISNEIIEKLEVSEKFNYQKISDRYEEKSYEQTIKRNLASSISQKLILRLSTTK